MKKKIILNWMTPAILDMPSPSMSVLKPYLISKGFNVEICYWNFIFSKLQTEFTWTNNFTDKDIFGLSVILNYLAIKIKYLTCIKSSIMIFHWKRQFVLRLQEL